MGKFNQQYIIAIIAGQLTIGGAERQLFLWLSHLDREKFSPIVLTLHPDCNDYWEKPISSLGIPLLPVPRQHNQVARLNKIIDTLRPYKPDLIHGWHLFSSPYAGAAAKFLGSKSLGFLQGSFQAFVKSPLEAISSFFFVDGMMTNSFVAGEQLNKFWKYKGQKVFVVPNAVLSQAQDRSAIRKKLTQQYDISESGIWIGTLGRLDPQKRFDLLLESLSWLRKDYKNFFLFLIGDGPEKKHLYKMIDRLNLAKNVIVTGEIPDARDYLSAFDVFCFTSLDEGLPNVVLEASAVGVPVVSWRVPFMEQIFGDSDTASLVEPENPHEFKAAILHLIESPEARVKIGQAGQRHVLSFFSIDQCVLQMTQAYEKILK